MEASQRGNSLTQEPCTFSMAGKLTKLHLSCIVNHSASYTKLSCEALLRKVHLPLPLFHNNFYTCFLYACINEARLLCLTLLPFALSEYQWQILALINKTVLHRYCLHIEKYLKCPPLEKTPYPFTSFWCTSDYSCALLFLVPQNMSTLPCIHASATRAVC